MSDASEMVQPKSAQPLEKPSAFAGASCLICPACGQETEHQLRYRKNFCNIFQCSSCGLGRAEANSFDPNTYYTANYFAGGMSMAMPTIKEQSLSCARNSQGQSSLCAVLNPEAVCLNSDAHMGFSYKKQEGTTMSAASNSRRVPRSIARIRV